MSPEFIDARDCVPLANGSVAIAGSLSHTGFGLPSAFDLGARDGSNVFDWGESDWGDKPRGLTQPPKHLFLGNLSTGTLAMTEIGGSVLSMDASPDGSSLALFEFWGSRTYAVSLADVASGRRRLLTVLDASGLERIRFSADGRWLLLGYHLIDAGTGRHVRLPIETHLVDWWNAVSPSTLLMVELVWEELPLLCSFDLITEQRQELGRITTPEASDPPPSGLGVTEFDVAPDGALALCGSKLGFPTNRETPQSPQDRVSFINVEQRTLSVQASPFVDADGVFEREHHHFRWLGDIAQTEVAVSPTLLASMNEATRQLGDNNVEYVAQNAYDIVAYGLNTMLGTAPNTSRPDAYRTEVLQAAQAIKTYDTGGEIFQTISNYLDNAETDLRPLCMTAQLPTPISESWSTFLDGWSSVKRGL